MVTNLVLILTILLVASMILYFVSFKEKDSISGEKDSIITYEQLMDNVLATWAKQSNKQDKIYKRQSEAERAETENTNLIKIDKAAKSGDKEARDVKIDRIYQTNAAFIDRNSGMDNFEAIMFSRPELMNSNQKFETIYYLIQKELKETYADIAHTDLGIKKIDSVMILFLKYTGALDVKKVSSVNAENSFYEVSKEDVDRTYAKIIEKYHISMDDALHIVSKLMYQELGGFPVIDSLVYDKSYTSLMGGYRGTTRGEFRTSHNITKSLVIKIPGKKVHLPFLEFKNPIHYENAIFALSSNHKRTFTAAEGILTTSLSNKLRVSIFTDAVQEFPAFNIRVPNSDRDKPDELLNKQREGVTVYNSWVASEMLRFSYAGMNDVIITGGQGSGKSSHLNAALHFLPAESAIRGLSNIDESDWNFKYPDRDIKLSLYDKDNPDLSIDKVSAILKRSDGEYFILTEALNRPEIVTLIDGRLSGWFGVTTTAHGADAEACIRYLVSNYVDSPTEDTFRLIADLFRIVVKYELVDGVYTMESITEVIPRDFDVKWMHYGQNDDYDEEAIQFMRSYNQQLCFDNLLNPKTFTTNRIVEFNRSTRTYQAVNAMSLTLAAKLLSRLPSYKMKLEFKDYLEELYPGYDLFNQMIKHKFIVLAEGVTLEKWLGGA